MMGFENVMYKFHKTTTRPQPTQLQRARIDSSLPALTTMQSGDSILTI